MRTSASKFVLLDRARMRTRSVLTLEWSFEKRSLRFYLCSIEWLFARNSCSIEKLLLFASFRSPFSTLLIVDVFKCTSCERSLEVLSENGLRNKAQRPGWGANRLWREGNFSYIYVFTESDSLFWQKEQLRKQSTIDGIDSDEDNCLIDDKNVDQVIDKIPQSSDRVNQLVDKVLAPLPPKLAITIILNSNYSKLSFAYAKDGEIT